MSINPPRKYINIIERVVSSYRVTQRYIQPACNGEKLLQRTNNRDGYEINDNNNL